MDPPKPIASGSSPISSSKDSTINNSITRIRKNTLTDVSTVPPPQLLNPLLDSIFNNQAPYKAPIKGIIDILSNRHNDYTILVPPMEILQSYYDSASEYVSAKTRLFDLCYNNDDFLKSHIIKTSQPFSSKTSASSSKLSSIIYNTVNGKQVLFKNGLIFPGKGFGKSLSVKILKIDYFQSVNNYFPQGSRFMIIYISDTILGSFLSTGIREEPGPFIQLRPPRKEAAAALPPTSVNASAVSSGSTPGQSMFTSSNIVDTITFEKLLRSFPLLSKAVSDKFYRLFHHNNYQFQILRPNRVKDLDTIQTEFNAILESAFKIVQDSVDVETPNSERTFDLINNIMKSYPGLDFNKIIHEYVELNLYDKVWTQLIHQFSEKQASPSSSMEDLANISLNQLDITITKPWQVNELYKRITLSIEEFKKLDDTSIVNSQSKTKILVKTIEILTNSSSKTSSQPTNGLLIDADTLIGLFMMVMIHSKINNLEAHLYYIKNFNSMSIVNDGYLNYILSNFDAVLFHLSSPKDEKHLIQSSNQNKQFWDYIKNGELNKIIDLFSSVKENELPQNHFLKSRNINGESCVMMAIKYKKFEVYKLLMEYNPNWFSIDDVLFDKNTTDDQNLVMCSIIEGIDDITYHLIREVIDPNATAEEKIVYYNTKDSLGRTIGHYLHHNINLIEELGPYLDWESKDAQGYTPLFSLCRCYDHPNYSELIDRAFQLVKVDAYSFDKHVDKNSNTLLHVIQRDLSKSRLLDTASIDINQFNNKNLTPLSLYVKFNRIDNLKELLKDKRLDFKKEDQTYFMNVLDYTISSRGGGIQSENSIEVDSLLSHFYFQNAFVASTPHKVLAFSAKYNQSNKDWVVYFKKRSSNSDFKSADENEMNELNEKLDEDLKSNLESKEDVKFYETIENISQIVYLMKLQFPISILPSKDLFFQNYPLSPATSVYPLFNKFKVNRFIEDVNLLFHSLNFHPRYSDTPSIWELMSDKGKKSTLELIREIKHKNELDKQSMGEIKLDYSKIQEIEFFLNFSMNDLLKFKAIIIKFNKALSLIDWKMNDFKLIQDSFIESWTKLQVNIESKSPHPDDDNQQQASQQHSRNQNTSMHGYKLHSDTSYNDLLRHTVSLLLYVTELTSNVSKTVDRIDTWKQLHSQIVEANGEIRKYENTHVTNTLNQNDVGGSGEAGDSISSFFNLSSIIESKQTKYKKLLYAKAEMIKKIMKINILIKMEHEALAAEISSFLKFKSDFLIFSLTAFSKLNARLCEVRKSELEKLSRTVRHKVG